MVFEGRSAWCWQGVALSQIYFCKMAACCLQAQPEFWGSWWRVSARRLCSGSFGRRLMQSATFVHRWKFSSLEGKCLSPVAVWQAACIVLVVSIQLSVESGCTAIKQLLSLNAVILSGQKNLSFAVSSTGRLQRLGWKLQVLPAVLPMILPCL